MMIELPRLDVLLTGLSNASQAQLEFIERWVSHVHVSYLLAQLSL